MYQAGHSYSNESVVLRSRGKPGKRSFKSNLPVGRRKEWEVKMKTKIQKCGIIL